MATLKTAIILVVIALVSVIQIVASLSKFQKTQWLPNSLQVTDDQGTIVARNIYSHDFLFTIAPYQDFLYFGSSNTRVPLRSDLVFPGIKPLSTTVYNYLFNPTQWTWKIPGQKLSYSYNLQYLSDGIKIYRSVRGNNAITKIGQAIRFCQTCDLVSNEATKIMIRNNNDGTTATVLVPSNSQVNYYPGNTLEIVVPLNTAQEIKFENQ